MKRLPRRKKGRSRLGAVGMEVAGALSAASQMALLYPPCCDERAYRELAGGVVQDRPRPGEAIRADLA